MIEIFVSNKADHDVVTASTLVRHRSNEQRFQVRIDMREFVVWTIQSSLERALVRAFASIPEVVALYCERDDEGVLMVFVVAAEHDDNVYEQVVVADDQLGQQFGTTYELRVRAHQGRAASRAVPVHSMPLFVR